MHLIDGKCPDKCKIRNVQYILDKLKTAKSYNDICSILNITSFKSNNRNFLQKMNLIIDDINVSSFDRLTEIRDMFLYEMTNERYTELTKKHK